MERQGFDVEAVGDVVEAEDGVLVIRRIVVRYRLAGIAPEHRAVVERVHGFHARFCPVHRSLEGGIEMETELELV